LQRIGRSEPPWSENLEGKGAGEAPPTTDLEAADIDARAVGKALAGVVGEAVVPDEDEEVGALPPLFWVPVSEIGRF
jgi:hypothetical protein